jgi:hypothetical protein
MNGFRWNRWLTVSTSSVYSKKLLCDAGRRSDGDARCGEDEAGCRAGVGRWPAASSLYHIKSMASGV